MVSTSETGHSKNVANFDELISFVSAYNTDYKPTRVLNIPTAVFKKPTEKFIQPSLAIIIITAFNNISTTGFK